MLVSTVTSTTTPTPTAELPLSWQQRYQDPENPRKNLRLWRAITDQNGGNGDSLASSRWWLRVVVRANRRSIQPLAV